MSMENEYPIIENMDFAAGVIAIMKAIIVEFTAGQDAHPAFIAQSIEALSQLESMSEPFVWRVRNEQGQAIEVSFEFKVNEDVEFGK